MQPLYPLKFKPLFKEKIWGGKKLASFFQNQENPNSKYGEAWSLVSLGSDVSVVSNGSLTNVDLVTLIKNYKSQLVGTKVYQTFQHHFPILIKFIDAHQDLSIQVHPDDRYAQKKGFAHGKNEMWYLLEAQPDAQLICGFKNKIDPQDFEKIIEKGCLLQNLNYEKVKKGDVYLIPSGCIHSLLKGVFLVEIQQSSDITYRIDDFGRVDSQNKKRPLHLHDAQQCLNFDSNQQYKIPYEGQDNTPSLLVKKPYFSVNFIKIVQSYSFANLSAKSFKILVCIDGKGFVNEENIQKGDVVLIPASMSKLTLTTVTSPLEILEVFLE